MLFIDLPSELLQLILQHSSTPSFVQLIRTCRTIFDLAAQSRDVVQHHLQKVPGKSLANCSSRLSTQKLFLTLRRRAAASLYGVNITADRRDFCFPGAVVDVSASCITSINHRNIALVRKYSSLVQLYEAFQGELKPMGYIKPKSDDKTDCRPLQTAFDPVNNVYVLYSVEKPFFRAPTTANLTRVKLSALSCPHDSWDIDEAICRDLLRDVEPVRPISMAAHSGDKMSIVWNSGLCVGHTKYMFITLYTLFKGRHVHSVCVNDLPENVWKGRNRNETPPEHCSYPTSSIAFSNGGRALKCYSAGSAAPTTRIQQFSRNATNNVSVNELEIYLDDDTTEWFCIEDPFFGYHKCVSNGQNSNAYTCHSVRLSLATVRPSSQNQTIACILRSCKTMPEDDCTHAINLDEPHALASTQTVEVVARLWGFKLPTTTMAAVMAFTKQGTRIAIAYWAEIFVWALRPGVLTGKFFDGEWDYANVYEKTHDTNLKRSIVELRPIVLKADAVVHKMAFTASENELITITDRGVQMWNLGPSATGRRSVGLLTDEQDARGKEAGNQGTVTV